MSLYEEWLSKAYDKEGRSIEKTWDVFVPKEQRIYEYILSEKITNMTDTVRGIAQKWDMTDCQACGFIDGINDIIPVPLDIATLETDTEISIDIDFEKLFKKMVECEAEHLYNLPQWDNIFTMDKKKELFWEQKKSRTYVRFSSKISRNDPCTCGSGKKYKKCCGR